MPSEEIPVVSLARNKNIQQAVISCLDRLNIPDMTGKNILLKPNVGREAEPQSGISTNPDVVFAIYNYLKERFNAKFFIGDSPIINSNTQMAFEKSGYSNLLEDKDLHFLDLDEPPPIEKKIPQGKVLKKIRLSGYWNEFDFIISIPVLKMHMHTGASLSFKNLKGLIYKRDKISLHHLQNPKVVSQMKERIEKIKELDIAIADLAYIIKPNLAIVDASYVQEGMGPSSGNCVRMDTIIASTNFLAADIIALALTRPEWSLKDVPHLKVISESIKNMPETREDIETIPHNIQEFLTPLEPPPTSVTIKYNNVNLIDIDSCSACLSTVFNLLKNNKEFIDENFTSEKPLNLAIGKGIKESDLYHDTFLIGNCTSTLEENGTFIKGCTPVESRIFEIIKEKLKK
ncbi:MAG: DUF362 domain-containing protein [Candidatus Hodarchaeales archaeon]|jgi:uncharacterized protein (DUF362 family)